MKRASTRLTYSSLVLLIAIYTKLRLGRLLYLLFSMKNVFLLALSLLSIAFFQEEANAQASNYQGVVLDADTRAPLVFVSIQRMGTMKGSYSDVDGNFKIKALPGDTLRLRYVGYEERFVVLKSQNNLTLTMNTAGVSLEEVVVRPEENPAWRIIRRALAARDQHDPAQKEGYSYQAYHKTVLGVDTLAAPPAKVREKTRKRSAKRDSALLEAAALQQRRQELFTDEMHLWVTETRSQHAFRAPHQQKEIILATQSSLPNDFTGGLNPINFQPFGFYKEVIRMEMTDQNYVNPLSKGTFQHYDFLLSDTIIHAQDTTFVIEFRPLPNKYFTALKGVLYIHTDGYAIERVIAAPADPRQTIQFSIQQESQRIEGSWFPVVLHADIFFQIGQGELFIKYGFRNRSVLTEVSLNPPPASFFNHYLKEVQSNTDGLDDSLRLLPLHPREANTYAYWDSLPELRPAYRVLSAYNSLIQVVSSGLWSGRKLDLVVPDLLNVNVREGTRLGLGLKTSPKLWKTGSLYAYGGYGFRDQEWKYGGALELKVYPQRDLKLRFSYRNDLIAPGSIDYLSSVNNPWANWSARNLILERLDNQEQIRVDLIYRPHGSVQLNFYAQKEERKLSYTYAFGVVPAEAPLYYQTEEYGTRLRWAPRERLVKMEQLEAILYPVFPILDFTMAHLAVDDFTAQRFTARLQHEQRWKFIGMTEITLETGWLSKALPYPYLFQAPGNSQNGITGNGLFNTAGVTEFAQEKFAYLFVTHRFGTLLGRLKTPYFRPELRLMQQLGWGKLSTASQHQGLDFQDMRRGYLESGAGLDNILRIPYFKTVYIGLGASVWYRWGAYHLPAFKDNVRVQFTVNISV